MSKVHKTYTQHSIAKSDSNYRFDPIATHFKSNPKNLSFEENKENGTAYAMLGRKYMYRDTKTWLAIAKSRLLHDMIWIVGHLSSALIKECSAVYVEKFKITPLNIGLNNQNS